METKIPQDQLASFSDFIARAIGLHFPPARWPDLQRGLAAAAAELQIPDPTQCIHSFLSTSLTQSRLDLLARHLTVGETYFFRERQSFELLHRHILPALLRSSRGAQRRLNIWSAGCCTGEEPYSIAISLIQAIPNWRDWNITLLGTDLNPNFLRKARAGRFGPWSFRNAPAGIQDQYFLPTEGGRFEVIPEVKQLVQFAQLNLVDDVYPPLITQLGGIDIIFCRNVLMYFTLPQVKRVLQKLHAVQSDGGWLLVSPSESPQILFPQYACINLNDVILYQKRSPNDAPIPLPAPVIPPPLPHPRKPTAMRRPPKPQRVEPPAMPIEQPTALPQLVRALANQGNLTEALQRCDQLITADKLNPHSHYLRSLILQEQNIPDSAIQSLHKAIYLDPTFVLAHVALGNINRHRGRWREATRHLDNALRLLRAFPPADVLPESDGVTAGRLAEIIEELKSVEVAA